MKVSFTGTRYGCTQAQKAALRKLLESLPMTEFHHGGCIGADSQAHAIAVNMTKVVVHPGRVDKAKQGDWRLAHKVLPAKPPLVRNQDIIDDGRDLTIACPKFEDEELCSGTWATVRYARKRKVPIKLVLPDGRVVDDVVKEAQS